MSKNDLSKEYIAYINQSLCYYKQEIDKHKDEINRLEIMGDNLFKIKKEIYNKHEYTDERLVGDAYQVFGRWFYRGIKK